MIRRTTGEFRSIAPPLNANLEDVVYVTGSTGVSSGQAQHTTGVSIIDRLGPIFPPTVEKVDLLSFAVSAMFAFLSPDNSPGYGEFGRILTGLTQVGGPTSSVDPQSNANVPWQLGAQLPADLSLVTDLWNPGTDPCPPKLQASASGPSFGLPVGATLTLPNSIPVFQGTDVFIGIWALPSLLSASKQAPPYPPPSYSPFLFQAKYTVVYDDGEK
jgi:hypothetical protein